MKTTTLNFLLSIKKMEYKLKIYKMTLTVDELWLEAIQNLINVDIYPPETMIVNSLEEINAG